MNVEEIARRFAELYPAVFRHLYRRRDPRVPRVSPEELAMLEHLRDTGPLTISEAARHFGLAQSTVSERVRRMTERGFVETIPDERDRRRHLTWLTPSGEETLRIELGVLSEELLLRAVRRMNPTDRVALTTGMRALLAAAREVARLHTTEEP